MTTPAARPQSVLMIVVLTMCMSILMYGLVLFTAGKLTYIGPEVTTDLEKGTLCAGLIVLLSRGFFRLKVVPEKDIHKRFTLTIVCLALNEFAALAGFLAVYMQESGNGFVFAANAALALMFNLLMLPAINSKSDGRS